MNRSLVVVAPLIVVATVLVAVLVPGHVVTGAAVPYCTEIVISTKTDEGMRVAERELRADPRVREVTARTKQENFEHFKKVLANQPELLEIARVEAIPATVNVVEQLGVDAEPFADELAQYGKATYRDLCALRKAHGV